MTPTEFVRRWAPVQRRDEFVAELALLLTLEEGRVRRALMTPEGCREAMAEVVAAIEGEGKGEPG